MSENPFASGPVDVEGPLAGTLLLEDGAMLASALESGNWIAGGMAAFSTVMDSVAMASDPLGTLIAMGLRWLLEHMQPLHDWQNKLAGDPAAVAGFAATWDRIDQCTTQLAGQLQTDVTADLAGMDAQMIQAYLAWQRDVQAPIGASATWDHAMSVAMGLAATLVQMVHDIVQDTIAQVAGAVISYAAEELFTVGLATPVVIE